MQENMYYLDCYWSGDFGVYGSTRGGLVSSPSTDGDLAAWIAKGNAERPLPVDSNGTPSISALDAILTFYGLPATGLAPPTQAQLVAYANARASTLIATLKAYGASPSILKADRTASTLADLMAIQQDAVTNPNDPVEWLANDDTVTVLTAAQIAALAPAVAADRKAIYAIAASAVTAINAGTITTTAQVSALAWPA